MKWLIDCINPEGVKCDDIPWEAPTAQEAVDAFNRMNPKATFECIKPGDFGISPYSKTVPLHFDDECGYLTKETLERARQALNRTMDERMKDIFGLNGLEAQRQAPDQLRYRIQHNFDVKPLPPGPIHYSQPFDPEWEDDEDDFDPWAEVAMFFGGKAYGKN